MTPKQVDEAIQRLSRTDTSHYDGPDAETCWAQAMAAVNYVGDAGEFEAVARRRGVMCNVVRGARNGAPQLFRLYVPCTGGSGWDGRS